MVSNRISTITCPSCGYQKAEEIPLDVCVYVYACEGCGRQLKPLPGDCCVFCSYGNVGCPYREP